MLHAENTVSALKKWDIAKGTHDVIFDRREYSKPQSTGCLQLRCLNLQRDSIFAEPVPADANLTAVPAKIRVGSILENAVALGANPPVWLTKILAVSLKVVETAGDKAFEVKNE